MTAPNEIVDTRSPEQRLAEARAVVDAKLEAITGMAAQILADPEWTLRVVAAALAARPYCPQPGPAFAALDQALNWRKT